MSGPDTDLLPPHPHPKDLTLISVISSSFHSRLTDFSCSVSLFLKVSFPFYSIIFRTISLISFQDMSSSPFEVSHISDDNVLVTRGQEESGLLEAD